MKILIIEDEPRAANQLQSKLKLLRFQYDLIDLLDTVEESINWFKVNSTPDLVFMDIQLADGLCFEIFQNVEVRCPIIFTTAFDQYAIQAFKVNSVDYLLKPIKEEDLSAALQKFTKNKQSASLDQAMLQQLLVSMQKPKFRSGILVKEGGGMVQVAISDFLYFYSEESITFGIAKDKRFIIEESIDQLISNLDPEIFYKINRGQILQKKSIQKIDSYFNHRVKLTVENSRDQEFIVSRQKTTDFKDWMNR